MAAAIFALVLLAGLGIFFWSAQPEPRPQAELAAEYEKGVQYQRGRGATLDYSQALFWYRKAAEGGYAPAEFAIGEMTLAGHGVARDEKAAIEWFRRAAEHDLPEAQVRYTIYVMSGAAQADGKGDNVEAMKWLLLGADRMDALGRETAIGVRDKLALLLSPGEKAEAERRAEEWREAQEKR